jgi:hypothetical protein
MQSAITVVGLGSAIVTSPLALARIARIHRLHSRNGIDRRPTDQRAPLPTCKPQLAALVIKAPASTARARRNQLDIAHRYEEFPDNHTSVDYRMNESLPFLAQALTG